MNNIKSDRRQSKALILSANVDKKMFETEFSIAICRPTGDTWKLKTLFLVIFNLRSSVVECFPLPPIRCEYAYLDKRIARLHYIHLLEVMC